MSDSLNAMFGRGEVTFKEKEKVGENQTPLTTLTIVQNKGEDYQQQIKLKAWGDKWAKAAAAFKKGDRINFGGELRRREWEANDETKKNAQLEVHLQDGDDNAMIAKADEDGDHNEVRITGEVSWAGEIETPTDDFQKQRIMVSVPKTTPSGTDIRLPYPVEVLGDALNGGFEKGKNVVLTGMVKNEFVRGEEGAENRFFASVIVSDKFDDHGIEAS